MNTDTQTNGTPESPSTALAVRSAREREGSIAAFSSQGNFEAAQRMAKALSSSDLVPQAYRGNLPNTLIAMELASRVGASVFMVMQNLDIIHGRPSWRSQFLIATVNACGRFSPIRYEFEGKRGSEEWGCRAVAKDRETGEECRGPLVTMAMAKDEGWLDKKGSKWQTLPELMLHYRAATFWTRIFAPELSMGMQTADEAEDVGARPGPSVGAQDLDAALQEVEAQVLDGSDQDAQDHEPSAELLDSLRALLDKARDAGAMSVDLEEQAHAALKSDSAAEVRDAKKALSRALVDAGAAEGQGDLLGEEG